MRGEAPLYLDAVRALSEHDDADDDLKERLQDYADDGCCEAQEQGAAEGGVAIASKAQDSQMRLPLMRQ